MLGCFFFLWISFCLAPSLATSDQGKDVESCFLYPVHDKTDSPFYDISGKGEHFVTVNHIFHETNVVQFLDEQGRCVVALTHNTSKQQVDCDQTFPSDGEYTTLVYRRLDDRLTAYKKNSLEYAIPLSTDIQKLRLTSYKMVNVAFGCPGNCYSFEKGTIHINYTQVNSTSSFKIFGRKKPSPDVEHLLAAEVMMGQHMNITKNVSINNLDLEVVSNQWFQLEFHVSFGNLYDGNIYDFYKMELIVKNPLKGKQDVYNLTASTKDLYLDFSQSVNVLWAIPCIPGREALTSDLEIGPALQRQADVALISLGCMCAVLAVISTAVTLYLCHLCRHQTFPTAASTAAVLLPPPPPPPADAAAVLTPPHSVGDSSVGGTAETDRTSLVEHHYDYIDLTVLREQMAEEESNSRGNSVEQHGSSEGRKSHTSINSVYGLARTDETVDDSSNANETVNRANAS
ncbi:uncharacterized protein [Macrobrachium rosenbergii]|uniref:uncharacterized protein isoform X3 n=1 Tax=Macrobrachium rosenbergii TaxID=79674 RepID=UPI0034D4DDBB